MPRTRPVNDIQPHAAQAVAVDLDGRIARLDDLEQRIAAICHAVPGQIAFATSLGLEEQAVLHAIAQVRAGIDVVTLDTGRHFPETLDTLDRSQSRYGVRIRVVAPDADELETLVARDGVLGFRHSIDARKACCEVRKVRPLNRELKGAQGWITGIRREHSEERADVALAAWDEERGLMKVNPIADWSTQELTAYIAENNVPVNPLHARGFISIGCQPCTRAVQPGEHPRAGRWWWEHEEKKECGLHMNPRREGKAA